LDCLSFKHRVVACRMPPRCLRCHGLRHRARDCLLPRRPPLRPSRSQLDVRVVPRDRPPDDQPLSTTTTGHIVVRGLLPVPGAPRLSFDGECFSGVASGLHWTG
jgi:hypothetical protein